MLKHKFSKRFVHELSTNKTGSVKDSRLFTDLSYFPRIYLWNYSNSNRIRDINYHRLKEIKNLSLQLSLLIFIIFSAIQILLHIYPSVTLCRLSPHIYCIDVYFQLIRFEFNLLDQHFISIYHSTSAGHETRQIHIYDNIEIGFRLNVSTTEIHTELFLRNWSILLCEKQKVNFK